MSTSSEQQTPTAQPTTQELPVAAPASGTPTTVQQLPPPSAPVRPPAPQPAPSTAAGPAAPVGAAQPTGPVDFIPGLPGAGTSTPPPDAAPAEQPRAPRDRTALAGVGLVGLSVVLLELGLTLRFGTESAWSAIPLWSAFATVCALLGLAAFAGAVPAARRLGARTGWRIAAGGLTGLAVFWVLVVLPGAGTDRGFLLTAALGALGGALWLGAGGTDRADGAAPRG
ncbi:MULTISPECIES: hypothetical protein [unclassified Blastococcus]